MTEFWQDPSLEPKRAFKFVLSIAGTYKAFDNF
jgi:hypothetical protein